jgi:GTP cyclohydrolase III
MTPKEKAEDLLYQMRYDHMSGTLTKRKAKRCVLIAVDEMMEVYVSACVAMGMSKEDAEKKQSKYLQEVKKEIELL